MNDYLEALEMLQQIIIEAAVQDGDPDAMTDAIKAMKEKYAGRNWLMIADETLDDGTLAIGIRIGIVLKIPQSPDSQ